MEDSLDNFFKQKVGRNQNIADINSEDTLSVGSSTLQYVIDSLFTDGNTETNTFSEGLSEDDLQDLDTSNISKNKQKNILGNAKDNIGKKLKEMSQKLDMLKSKKKEWNTPNISASSSKIEDNKSKDEPKEKSSKKKSKKTSKKNNKRNNQDSDNSDDDVEVVHSEEEKSEEDPKSEEEDERSSEEETEDESENESGDDEKPAPKKKSKEKKSPVEKTKINTSSASNSNSQSEKKKKGDSTKNDKKPANNAENGPQNPENSQSLNKSDKNQGRYTPTTPDKNNLEQKNKQQQLSESQLQQSSQVQQQQQQQQQRETQRMDQGMQYRNQQQFPLFDANQQNPYMRQMMQSTTNGVQMMPQQQQQFTNSQFSNPMYPNPQAPFMIPTEFVSNPEAKEQKQLKKELKKTKEELNKLKKLFLTDNIKQRLKKKSEQEASNSRNEESVTVRQQVQPQPPSQQQTPQPKPQKIDERENMLSERSQESSTDDMEIKKLEHTMKTQLLKKQKRIQELTEQIGDTKKVIFEKEIESKAEKDILEKKNAELKSLVLELKEELKLKEDQISQKNEFSAQKMAQIENAERKYLDKCEECEQLQKNLKKHKLRENTLKEVEKQNSRIQKSYEDLSNEYNSVKRSHQTLEEEKLQALHDKELIEVTLSHKMDECESVNRSYSDTKKALEKSLTMIEDLRSELSSVSKEREQLNIELNKYREEARNSIENAEKLYSSKLSEIQGREKKIKDATRSLQSELEETKKQAEESSMSYDQEVGELKTALMRESESKKDLECELDKMKSKMTEEIKHRLEQNMTIKRMELENSKVRKMHLKLKQEQEDLEEKLGEVESNMQVYREMYESVVSSEANEANPSATNSNTLIILRKRQLELEKNNFMIQEKLKDFLKKNEDFQKLIDEVTEEIKQIQHLQKDLDNFNDSLFSELKKRHSNSNNESSIFQESEEKVLSETRSQMKGIYETSMGKIKQLQQKASEEYSQYRQGMSELVDEISEHGKELESLRDSYSSGLGNSKKSLSGKEMSGTPQSEKPKEKLPQKKKVLKTTQTIAKQKKMEELSRKLSELQQQKSLLLKKKKTIEESAK